MSTQTDGGSDCGKASLKASHHRRRDPPVLELPVLPADVDHQTVPVKLQSLFFAVLAHLLSILSVLHFDECLKTSRKRSLCVKLSDRSRLQDLLLDPRDPEVALRYLSLDPVGEVFADFPERFCQFEDGLV